jgi:hypothetical protein
VPVGLMLRRTLPETLHPEASKIRPPVIGSYARVAIFAFLTLLSSTITNYVLNYMTTFAKATLGMAAGVSLGATVVIGLANLTGSLLAGLLSDRYGRLPWMTWPMMLGAIAVMPGFWLLTTWPSPTTLYAVGIHRGGRGAAGPDQIGCPVGHLRFGNLHLRRIDTVRRHVANSRDGQSAGPGLVYVRCCASRCRRFDLCKGNRTGGVRTTRLGALGCRPIVMDAYLVRRYGVWGAE